MVHLISLELNGLRMPDELARLATTIREMGECYAFQKTAWFVECELSNDKICEKLTHFLRPNDRIMVMRVYRDWVSANVPQDEVDWLSQRNFHGAHDQLTR